MWPQMNLHLAQSLRYCRKCKKHTGHKVAWSRCTSHSCPSDFFLRSDVVALTFPTAQVSQYKTGKASLSAQGKRRYASWLLGEGPKALPRQDSNLYRIRGIARSHNKLSRTRSKLALVVRRSPSSTRRPSGQSVGEHVCLYLALQWGRSNFDWNCIIGRWKGRFFHFLSSSIGVGFWTLPFCDKHISLAMFEGEDYKEVALMQGGWARRATRDTVVSILFSGQHNAFQQETKRCPLHRCQSKDRAQVWVHQVQGPNTQDTCALVHLYTPPFVAQNGFIMAQPFHGVCPVLACCC